MFSNRWNVNLHIFSFLEFAASEPVQGLEEGALLQYFNDLRQLLDLLMSWDWSTYFHDHGQENSKYKHVNPVTAIAVLEKYVITFFFVRLLSF